MFRYLTVTYILLLDVLMFLLVKGIDWFQLLLLASHQYKAFLLFRKFFKGIHLASEDLIWWNQCLVSERLLPGADLDSAVVECLWICVPLGGARRISLHIVAAVCFFNSVQLILKWSIAGLNSKLRPRCSLSKWKRSFHLQRGGDGGATAVQMSAPCSSGW